jgi:hypothetical protein
MQGFSATDKLDLRNMYPDYHFNQKRKHVNHAISQLRRFAVCALNGKEFKSLQIFTDVRQ